MRTTNKIIAIGASTGGTTAIETFLREMPANAPGTVIVQHMPEGFTRTFAERLNSVSQMTVSEARDNDLITPGVALVAPGNHHLVVKRDGAYYVATLKTGPLVFYQRPAVELLFQSVARSAGSDATDEQSGVGGAAEAGRSGASLSEPDAERHAVAAGDLKVVA